MHFFATDLYHRLVLVHLLLLTIVFVDYTHPFQHRSTIRTANTSTNTYAHEAAYPSAHTAPLWSAVVAAIVTTHEATVVSTHV